MAYCKKCNTELDFYDNCPYCNTAHALYKIGCSKLYEEKKPEEAYQYFKEITTNYKKSEEFDDALYQISVLDKKDITPAPEIDKDELLKRAQDLTKNESQIQTKTSTTWINILDTCANITIALGIIASIVIGISIMSMEELVLVGFIIMAIGCLLSVVSAAGIKTLIGVAKDIHFIRNKAETNSNDTNGK